MAPEVDHNLILFKTKWTIFKACMILTLLSGDEVYLCKSCFRHVEFGGRPRLLDNQILELFHNWRTQVVLMMLVSGGISPFWAGTDIATQRRVVSDYWLSWAFVSSFTITICNFPLKKCEDSSLQSRAQFSLDDPAFEVVSNNSKELIKKWEFHIITIFTRIPLYSQVAGADSDEKTDSQGSSGSSMACLWPQDSSAWQVKSLELFWNRN